MSDSFKYLRVLRSFDLDGVIFLDGFICLTPTSYEDIIVTGRSYEEAPDTIAWLRDNGITNQVFFNPTKFNDKTRVDSGKHKARILTEFLKKGYDRIIHFDDDIHQINVIKSICPKEIIVVQVNTNGLIELENVESSKGYLLESLK